MARTAASTRPRASSRTAGASRAISLGRNLLPPTANLALWLDPEYGLYQDSAGTTVASADGDPVGRWVDRMGLSVWEQTTASKRPTLRTNVQNGRRILRCDGVDDVLRMTTTVQAPIPTLNTGPWSVLAVAKRTGAGTGIEAIFHHDSVYLAGRFSGNANWGVYITASVVSGDNLSSFKVIGSVARALNDIDMLTNGVKTNRTNGSAWYVTSNDGVGASGGSSDIQHFGGDVAEILMYSAALSQSEWAAAVAYLNSRWACF